MKKIISLAAVLALILTIAIVPAYAGVSNDGTDSYTIDATDDYADVSGIYGVEVTFTVDHANASIADGGWGGNGVLLSYGGTPLVALADDDFNMMAAMFYPGTPIRIGTFVEGQTMTIKYGSMSPLFSGGDTEITIETCPPIIPEYGFVDAPEITVTNVEWLLDPVMNGTVDVQLKCIMMGQVAVGATINLNDALPASVTADDLKTGLTATALFDGASQGNQTITSATISSDRKAITLAYEYGLLNIEGYSTFTDYTITGSVGGVDFDIAFGKKYDPEVDQFLPFDKNDTELPIDFRLFVPSTSTGKVPLILWLHGGSSTGLATGNNNYSPVAEGMTNWISSDIQSIFGGSAYIMAPQSAETYHEPAQIMEALEYVLDEYDNIDTSRIYVGGGSLGGNGTLRMITAYPEFFAAAFPICPYDYTLSTTEAAKLVNLPIYFVTCIADDVVDPTTSINSYKNLIAAGSTKAHITLFSAVAIDGIPDALQPMFQGMPNVGHASAAYVTENFPNSRNSSYMIVSKNYSFTTLVDKVNVTGAVSESPVALGYTTFVHWLAAQQKVTTNTDTDLFTVSNSKFSVSGTTITVPTGTTVSGLISGLTLASGVTVKVMNGDTEVTGDTVLTSAMTVQFYKDGALAATYSLVISGTNGGGTTSDTDTSGTNTDTSSTNTDTGNSETGTDAPTTGVDSTAMIFVFAILLASVGALVIVARRRKIRG